MDRERTVAVGRTPGPADTSEGGLLEDVGWAPDPERVVSDVETLRAISDPMRLAILETMVRRPGIPWSVKELASRLDVPPTRLYHHIEQLLARDLVRPAERRIVSGIVETRYRVSAMSLRLDRGLLARDEAAARSAFHDMLGTLFDSARHEIEASIRAGRIRPEPDAPPEHRLLATRMLAHLSPVRAAELQDRLSALLEAYADDAGEGTAFGIVLAVYPMTSPDEDREARRD